MLFGILIIWLVCAHPILRVGMKITTMKRQKDPCYESSGSKGHEEKANKKERGGGEGNPLPRKHI